MNSFSSQLLRAFNKKRVQYFQSAFNDLPGWPEFVEHINVSKHRGDIDLRRKFYMRAPIHQQDLAEHLTKLGSVQRLLQDQLSMDVTPLNSYINLATREEVWPSHADDENALFIQCAGSVIWYLDEEEYVLNPGDAIYFPSGTMHEVQALTPRAAVIFEVG